MFLILDIITRLLILTALIVAVKSTIDDIKSGALKNFFGDDDGED